MIGLVEPEFERLFGRLSRWADDTLIWDAIEALPYDASLIELDPYGALSPYLASSFMVPVEPHALPGHGFEPHALLAGAFNGRSVRTHRIGLALERLERLLGRSRDILPYDVAASLAASGVEDAFGLGAVLYAVNHSARLVTDAEHAAVLLAAGVLLTRRASKLATSGHGRRVTGLKVNEDAWTAYRRLALEVGEFIATRMASGPPPKPANRYLWVLRPPDYYDQSANLMPEYLLGRVGRYGLQNAPLGLLTSHPVVKPSLPSDCMAAWGRLEGGRFLTALDLQCPRRSDRYHVRYFAQYLSEVCDVLREHSDHPMTLVTRDVQARGVSLDIVRLVSEFSGRRVLVTRQKVEKSILGRSPRTSYVLEIY